MANDYLKIRDVKFETIGEYDVASWFYSTLEADKVKYLVPKIWYDGLVQASKKITLFVKIFRPDGTLHEGTSSPKGYSYSYEMTVLPGRNNYCVLTGWGNAKGGSYKPGIHRIEIWCDGNRIYSQDFTLTGKDPLSVKNIKFGSSGKDGEVNLFYEKLDAAEVRYLTPQVCYDGLVQASKKVTLFVKIFRPDGTLHDGASSPKGYSYSCDVTVSPGRSNYCVLTGWGNDAGGCYNTGIHRIELWYDGNMIYNQNFTLTKFPRAKYINGHEYVDLGLSVMWATCNIGARTPSDFGDYFAWGETRTKSEYTIYNSENYRREMPEDYVSKYEGNGCWGDYSVDKITGNPQYDAARAIWGGEWHLPTLEELEELIHKCNWIWTSKNGHYGYVITGPSGNSIFLPAAGECLGSTFNAHTCGTYWSSSFSNYSDEGEGRSARYLDFRSNDDFYWNESHRAYGRSIRPVIKVQTEVSSPTGTINGYGFVDLGLSVKWAECNICAFSPADSGGYFAWGETREKHTYLTSNSISYGREFYDIAGNPQYDAARANWGGTWRLPKPDEIDELINKCWRVWTTYKDKVGCKITGPNGNSIFLPATGFINKDYHGNCDWGYYWCSAPAKKEDLVDQTFDLKRDGPMCSANYLIVNNEDILRSIVYRFGGICVRAVSD